jgi:hypothetical protein
MIFSENRFPLFRIMPQKLTRACGIPHKAREAPQGCRSSTLR